MTSPIELNCTSFRHASKFECIGEDCQEDCCHNWKVILDKTSYEKTKKNLARTSTNNLQFNQHVRKKRKKRTSEKYADVILLDNGDCPFLNPADRLCVIHRDFGESCLSKTCRTYPRKLAMVGNHLELSLELSCPEAARGFIFDEEFNFIQIDRSTFMDDHYNIDIYSVDNTNPLTQYVDLIRNTVLQLLNIAQYPLNSRLFFLTFFAHRTVPFFTHQIKYFSESLLAKELELLGNSQVLDGLHKQFKTSSNTEDLPIDLPMSYILSILTGRTGKAGSLNNLLLKIWQNYNHDDSFSTETGKATDDALNKMTVDYKILRNQTPNTVTEQFDKYLLRYSQYFWFSNIYTQSPNLLIHTRRLFIRLALLRFLLYSHPEMNEFRELESKITLSKQQNEKIGKVALEVFYILSRGIEHSPGLLTAIEHTLDKNNMRNFEHVYLLLLI